MNKENLIKVVTGTSKIIQGTTEMLSAKGASFIEERVLKGNYVTRAEFDQLKKLVEKLEAQLLAKP